MESNTLNNIDIWDADFSQDELSELRNEFGSRWYEDGEILVQEKAEIGHIFVLLAGSLLSSKATKEKGERLRPGMCLGIMTNLRKQPSPWDIRADDEAEVVAVKPDDFLNYWISSPQRCRVLLKKIIEEQDKLNVIGDELYKMAQASKLRLAEWLDHWHERIADNQGKGISIGLGELEAATGIAKSRLVEGILEMKNRNMIALVKAEKSPG